MRLFIGLRLDPAVKDYCHHIQTLVRGAAIRGHFSRYDNFHITLSYIGEVPGSQYEEICDLMDEITRQQASFTINIGNLGSFKRDDKHIVFTKVIDDVGPLMSLQHKLEKILLRHEIIKPTRSYHPHITLSRDTMLTNVPLLDLIDEYPAPIEINQITLFESNHNKKGELHYDVVYESRFSKKQK